MIALIGKLATSFEKLLRRKDLNWAMFWDTDERMSSMGTRFCTERGKWVAIQIVELMFFLMDLAFLLKLIFLGFFTVLLVVLTVKLQDFF